MNRLDTTLGSLSYLIENLYKSHALYSALTINYPALSGIIEPLNIRTCEFLYKLMNEYKRLSAQEYRLNTESSSFNKDRPSDNILDECLKAEETLISIYSEIIGEDVLWEVLPVLAHHLTFLKTHQGSLTEYSKRSIIAV